MDRDRLRRLRTIQSWVWYETLIMRPIAILVLYPIADWKFLTPNLMTTLGNLCKLAGAGLILRDDATWNIWAFVLIQVGVLFDHLDGTLARYRKRWSSLGSFYDKVSDLITWTVIVLAIAWVAEGRRSDHLALVLAVIATNSQAIIGYMKWVAKAESDKLQWRRAQADPDLVERMNRPPVMPEPPERTVGDWLRWVGRIMLNIFALQEMDLYLWAGILVLLDQHMLAIYGVTAIQGAGLVIMLVVRLRDMKKLDRELARARSEAGENAGENAGEST